MADYTNNSHKFKEQQAANQEKKEIKKVVNGKVLKKKKNMVKDVFISDDVANIKSYVVMDVLVPAVKKAISDIVVNGIDMMLYGEANHTKKRGASDRISYRNYYDDKRDADRGRATTTRTGYSYDDIILESRGEAEEVLNLLDEAISAYGVVSVADLYDLVGVTGAYTDNKYGWTNLRNAEAVRVRDGYLLKLPKALPIS